ncbi:MOSC domain-containing protein [Larkinella soli]|uniref:MOSC domain-containing protein n=1 Tax=Larkinella soli TaxID=1770527 RepID=UPI000FFB6E26|nr:MOSC N-terminal beta barrel domain-containing protein [Larkinella soli]
MNAPLLKEIRIYPIKSLGGIVLPEAVVEPKGFRYDRRWMLVSPDPAGGPARFLTQRAHTVMALVEQQLTDTTLRVFHRRWPDDVLEVPLSGSGGERLDVTVWDDTVTAEAVGAEADAWFSRLLGFPARLVHMPDDARRPVDQKYARPGDLVSFADGYPFLAIGTGSMDELNRRLDQPLEMTRFRPNLIMEGTRPHEEDTWYHFRIGGLDFYGVKPCARCVLTTVDPQTGQKGKEPLRTLGTYRQLNNKIYFGQNVLPASAGTLRVGSPVQVLEYRPALVPFG